MLRRHALRLLALSLLLPLAGLARADTVQVAVAANFSAPMQAIAKAFEQQSGNHLELSSGATGKFYTQIKAGAPFAVLLAADAKTPQKLVREGDGVAGSEFSYARGKLVLWSANATLVDVDGKVLADTGKYSHLAVANPALAPYGAAAMQVLQQLGLTTAVQGKLVTGENIGQTYEFAASGNAELGFVALSQVYADGRISKGSAWVVPAKLYDPLQQDAVLLKTGETQAAARALLDFLRSDTAKAIIRSYGYDI